MNERYELKVYKGRARHRQKTNMTLYGVWDNKFNNWVINTEGVAKSTAERYLRALKR